ncbi:MAG TPA: hypothetical protein VFO96_13915 [Gemmatimonadales bacterium]|jgi:hypothetical protein|nr:hypothetical protein [Gemmatimonadales bacterium]
MPDIRLLISIARGSRDVFGLVAGATGFTSWWSDDIALKSDGAIEVGMADRAQVYRLRPETMVMPARAAWMVETGAEWAGTSLVFDLTPDESGTRLLFTHAGWGRTSDVFLESTAMWGALLFRLKEAAENGTEHPLFSRASPARG